jgi:hypothetical protein
MMLYKYEPYRVTVTSGKDYFSKFFMLPRDQTSKASKQKAAHQLSMVAFLF